MPNKQVPDSSYNADEIAQWLGEAGWMQQPKFISIDEITIDGSTGEFMKQYYDTQARQRVKDAIGKSVSVVMLKKRSKLSSFDDNGNFLITSEFDGPTDIVQLFGSEGLVEVSPVSEIKKNNPQMKKQEIFYCILLPFEEAEQQKLVRVVFRGSSLGSKDDTITGRLYDYLADFTENKEHVWQYATLLSSVKAGEREEAESGDSIPYYAINCTKKTKLSDQEIALHVVPAIRQILTEIERLSTVSITKKSPPKVALTDEEIEVVNAQENTPEELPF